MTPALPNLLLIGAMKASSTQLYDMLGSHPGVFASAEKEPHYFTSPEYGDADAWSRYLDLFRGSPAEAVYRLEGSTGYSKMPRLGPTAERIRKDLGEPRLIYLLRDPVSRIVSNYGHSYSFGLLPKGVDIVEAVERDPILVTGSLYGHQIAEYERAGLGDGLKIVVTERLHREPGAVCAELCDWLGIEAVDLGVRDEARNSRADVQKHSTASRLVGGKTLDRLRGITPGFVRRMAKSLVPAAPPPPEVTEAHKAELLRLVADDLRLVLERVPEAAGYWPSAAAIGASRASGVVETRVDAGGPGDRSPVATAKED